jgi:2-C-methyl-D-erythritol 4-phosphate cytidylyltransferase
MKKYAVIVAGGAGLRMGTMVPKQFLLLRGKPVLWHTLKVFLDAYEDLDIILVLPEKHMETGRAILYATDAPHRIRMIPGGVTRFHSVKNGLACIPDIPVISEASDISEASVTSGASVIFVHDGVRCLLTTELVHRCYENAVQYGTAIPVIDSKDSVRLVTPAGNEAIDRARVKLVQTPQTFLSSILLPSYEVEYREAFTDEATVVEAFDHAVHLVEGEMHNIKITTPADLVLAEQLLILSSKE